MRIINIVEYQHSWPVKYKKEASLLMNAIGFLNPSIHHIGSTSVPGLAAKPIIDILIEVDNISVLDTHGIHLEKVGYLSRGELGIAGRRFFQKGGNNRSHHIHAFKRRHEDAVRHIAFRDYLIKHKDIAQQYASLKKQVALACNHDIDQYCDGKNAFIKKHEDLALRWYATKH